MARRTPRGFVWVLEMERIALQCEACEATMTPVAGVEAGATDWAARHVLVCPRRKATPSAAAPDVALPYPD